MFKIYTTPYKNYVIIKRGKYIHVFQTNRSIRDASVNICFAWCFWPFHEKTEFVQKARIPSLRVRFDFVQNASVNDMNELHNT